MERYVALQSDFETAVNAYGKGIELDVVPWLRFLPNETYKLLKYVRSQYHEVNKKLLRQRMVSLLHLHTLIPLITHILQVLYTSQLCSEIRLICRV